MTDVEEIVTERRPQPGSWRQLPLPPRYDNERSMCASLWRRASTTVLSELVVAIVPDTGSEALYWHVSISKHGRRIDNPHWTRKVLREFAMAGAEEVSHSGGGARGFWLAVDEKHRPRPATPWDEASDPAPDRAREGLDATADNLGSIRDRALEQAHEAKLDALDQARKEAAR